MKVLKRFVRVLTLVSAGLAAIVFPITLFAMQGMSRIGLQEAMLMLGLYLFQPVSIALIFLVSFGRFAQGRSRQVARAFIAFNASFLLAIAALLAAGVFQGTPWLPVVFAVPSLLCLLTLCMRAGR